MALCMPEGDNSVKFLRVVLVTVTKNSTIANPLINVCYIITVMSKKGDDFDKDGIGILYNMAMRTNL